MSAYPDTIPKLIGHFFMILFYFVLFYGSIVALLVYMVRYVVSLAM